MKIVCIADTHSLHDQVNIPDGDVLVHAGDLTNAGSTKDVIKFNSWIGKLPHKHKIIIAGNHDRCFEHSLSTKAILTNAIYLQDSAITIDNILFWGSPWQPMFYSWAFNLPRGRELAKKWNQIPYTTDVLITHGPPVGILDQTTKGDHVGCVDLKDRISNLHNIKLHVFGHIHNAYGKKKEGRVQYVNASICTEKYDPINEPIVVDI